MANRTHGVREGRQTIKSGETLTFSVDCVSLVDNDGAAVTITSITSVTVFRERDETDVTATIMPAGSASIGASNLVTLPPAIFADGMETGRYRVEVAFVAGGYNPGIFEVEWLVIE